MMADLHPTERLYRKIVKPSLGVLSIDSHTSRHRIQLHSSFQPRMQGQLYTLRNRPKTNPTDTAIVKTFPRITDALNGSPEFSSNFVYSYHSQVQDDLSNLQRSMTPQSFNSTSKVKQVPLPSVSPPGKSVSLRSASPTRGVKSVSICSDRYLGTQSRPSSTPKPNTISQEYRESKTMTSGTMSAMKIRSEQQRRFETEGRSMLRSRALKRASEITPHRIDRMYYMSGATVPLKSKYLIDNEELERLKDMSRARSNRSLRARSGASKGDDYLADRHIGESRLAILQSESEESPSVQEPSTLLGANKESLDRSEDENRPVTASSRSTEESDNVAGARVRFKAAGSSSAKACIPGNMEEDEGKEDDQNKDGNAEGEGDQVANQAEDSPRQDNEDGYDSGLEPETEVDGRDAQDNIGDDDDKVDINSTKEGESVNVEEKKGDGLFMTEYNEDNQEKGPVFKSNNDEEDDDDDDDDDDKGR
ncbi:uncharacterized protein LOC144437373 isoform X2 [Glandiceps talaboti]